MTKQKQDNEADKPHKGLDIPGYVNQSERNVQMVTKMKQSEEGFLRILDTLAQSDAIDKRWLAIGRTGIEQAFMAINRSIFQPPRVALPGDETAQK